MGAPLGLARTQGQNSWCGPGPGSGISRPRTRPAPGPAGEVEPHDITPFSMKRGSADSLKVSVRWGCSAKARQMRLTVLWLRPERRAMDRVLQCVASFGVVSRVSVTTLSTSASVTVRGLPGLASSTSPSSRLSRNRDLHLPTVACDTLNSAATAVFVLPLEHSNTIRAR